VFVTDLHHFLDLPEDAPGPARRLGEHLANIVRAAAAGDATTVWETALPCRRRPRNRACPGRISVLRTEVEEPIRWQCGSCDDQGVISNWEDSPFDLRRHGLILTEPAHTITLDHEVAAALRDLRLLDLDCERLVFRIHTDHDHPDIAVLTVTDDELEELIGFVAAEANHEPNRRRQRRLDTAFHTLNTAAQTPHSW
jgi:hypothetical protein